MRKVKKILPLDVGSSPPRHLRRRHCPTPPEAAWDNFRPSAERCWIDLSPLPAAALSPYAASGGAGLLSAFGLHLGAASGGVLAPHRLRRRGTTFGLRPSLFRPLAGDISNLQNGIPFFRFSFDAENCLVFTAKFLS